MRTLTHAELQISPLNVRQNKVAAEAVDALAENIAAEGMMFPLIVHPMALLGDEGGTISPSSSEAVGQQASAPFGIYAGGRRWRAIGRLIEQGRLPADHPIECVVREFDPARITDQSLAENLLRRELEPWEVHAAIARSAAQGHTPDQIAATLGQDPLWVRQQLRLGTLAPEIFTAYADGQLSFDQAKAYAATEDHGLQLTAWKHFRSRPEWDARAHHIRAFLKIGDRELETLLRFVGDDAYRLAGGRFELDLFADGPADRGRVVDEALLRQLAEQRLEDHRALERQLSGRPDLRFAKEPPQNAGTTDWGLQIDPVRGKGKLRLPDGDVIATLAIGDDGEVETAFWFASRKAKSAAARAASEARVKGEAPPADANAPVEVRAHFQGGRTIPDDGAFDGSSRYAQAGRQVIKEKYGLTADGLEVIRSLRRALLRAMVAANAVRPWQGGPLEGTLGRDYLIWSACRQELGGDKHTVTGARGLGDNWRYRDAEPAVVRQFLEDEPVVHQWEQLVQQVAEMPFMAAADPADSLQLYVDLDEATKDLVAAILAGMALVRSANVPGWRVRAHDKLAELAGGDDQALRTGWRPTAAFMALFPKLKRLELAQPHVDPEAFRTWHKHDDRTITGATAGALEQAEGWVHPLLSFNVGAHAPAGDSAQGLAGPDDAESESEQEAGPVDPAVNDEHVPELQVAAE